MFPDNLVLDDGANNCLLTIAQYQLIYSYFDADKMLLFGGNRIIRYTLHLFQLNTVVIFLLMLN